VTTLVGSAIDGHALAPSSSALSAIFSRTTKLCPVACACRPTHDCTNAHGATRAAAERNLQLAKFVFMGR
jgi:hypothetical protein